VGAISNYLNKIISLPVYNRFHHNVENFLKTRVPRGSRLIKLMNKFEEGLKGYLSPGCCLKNWDSAIFAPLMAMT